MYPVTHNAPPFPYHAVEPTEYLGETPTGLHYNAVVHPSPGIPPGNVRIELGRNDARMRVFVQNAYDNNALSNAEPRDTTPAQRNAAAWLRIKSSEQLQRNFLNTWQEARTIPLVDENHVTEIIVAEQRNGTIAESAMDEGVVLDTNATSNSSVGAGSAIVVFLRGVTSHGHEIFASIQKNVSEENPLSPDTAYQAIIRPLEEKMTEATRGIPLQTSFYFVGGYSGNLLSCVALAIAAQRSGLNVPVSMLATNDSNTYVDAVLCAPSPRVPGGGFFVARVDEGPDDE